MKRVENNYDFRKKLLQIHQKGLRNHALLPNKDELSIEDGFAIDIPIDASDVILTAAKDFQDYLFTCMGVSVMLKQGGTVNGTVISVVLDTQQRLTVGKGYMGYGIIIEDNITILAHDDRGAAQAFYYLEDLMSLRHAPYLKKETVERKTLFSPRMTHSGYGVDQYPDAHLSAIAHAGMDAILVFTKGVDVTPSGYTDFNELIYRASKYGIDVYAYSYMYSKMHPDENGAREYYEDTYGKLFRKCPKLKGVVLVGESIEFPSKDPNVSKVPYYENFTDGIPNSKRSPGWWPCYDYPQFVAMIRDTIRAYNPEADIVFWTYNWGGAPVEERLKMIRSLPTDISLQVTYEMFERYETNGVWENTADYTLCLEGPGKYFVSEAEVAKECGIRLYSMVNTGGRTWDFGVVPYEPFPYQWQKRYDSIKKAQEQWGLCGLMESHHYGFYPSFISELTKWNFTATNIPQENILEKVLVRDYGEEYAPRVNEALEYWSEAITHYIATGEDQYGPFRIGPAYPLCLLSKMEPVTRPYAMFGNTILETRYRSPGDVRDFITLPSIRIRHEIKSLEQMETYMKKGITILETIPDENEALATLLNLGRYMKCCIRTVINTKRFCVVHCQLNSETDPKKIKNLIAEAETIANEEIRNAHEAIPYAEADSSLGWEPSMEYMADREHIEWKIRQVQYMIDNELVKFKAGLKLSEHADIITTK